MINFLNKYNFLVFDCDGVILDSNRIKTDGFKFALAKYPVEKVEQLISFHQTNGGISRYEKFEYFFKKILGLDEFKSSYENTLLKFSSYMDQELFKVNLVKGVEDFIHYCIKKRKRLYIVSGGDKKELHRLFKKKKIEMHFSLILGSPINKSDNLKEILDIEKSKKGLFIGDSRTDYFCAKEQGLDFMFVEQFSEDKGFFTDRKDQIDKTIYNFYDKDLYK